MDLNPPYAGPLDVVLGADSGASVAYTLPRPGDEGVFARLVFLISAIRSQRPFSRSPKPHATSATRGGTVIRPCLKQYDETWRQ